MVLGYSATPFELLPRLRRLFLATLLVSFIIAVTMTASTGPSSPASSDIAKASLPELVETATTPSPLIVDESLTQTPVPIAIPAMPAKPVASTPKPPGLLPPSPGPAPSLSTTPKAKASTSGGKTKKRDKPTWAQQKTEPRHELQQRTRGTNDGNWGTSESGENDELYAGGYRGDKAAARRMIEGNMPYVLTAVESYIRCFPHTEHLRNDMVSEGFVGLCTAIDKIAS